MLQHLKVLIIDCPHPYTKNRYYCGVCSNTHFPSTSQRDSHLRIRHNACPTCLQTFSSEIERKDHQKATEHSHCIDCGLSFSTLPNLMKHILSQAHSKEIEASDTSVNHSDDLATTTDVLLARAEEVNLWCEECNRSLATVGGFHKHKTSSKHRPPVVSIKCSCRKEFTLVSAFVQHLESSRCKFGMTRDKLNAIIYRYDLDRTITMAEHAGLVGSTITGQSQSSIAPFDSASNLAPSLSRLSLNSSRISEFDDDDVEPEDSDVDSINISGRSHILTPKDSDSSTGSVSSGVILTPERSDRTSASSDGSFMLTPSASNTESEGGVRSLSSDSSSDAGVLLTPSASTIETQDGIASVSSDSSCVGGAILTPSASTTRNASGEWYFLDGSYRPTPSTTSVDGSSVATLRVDPNSGLPSCSKCDRTFTTDHALRQHLNSGTHAPKIFHCPTGILGSDDPGLPDREFKSLSGLAQHIEAGHCGSGEGALMAIADIMKGPMQKKLGMHMRMLAEDGCDSNE